MGPAASNNTLNRTMADDNTMINGSHEDENPLLKTTQSTEDQSYALKNGDNLNQRTCGHGKTRGDSGNTYRGPSL